MSFIHQKMLENERGPDVAYMREKLKTTWVDVVVPRKQDIESIQALHRWYQLVKNRAPWDYKQEIISRFGRWMDDPQRPIRYGYDIWANLHYGYIGLACGFSQWTLLQGAGFAQWRAGTSPDGYWERRLDTLGDADVAAALDDPKDQEAIRAGFSLWEDFGASVQPFHLWNELRKRANRLSTEPRGGFSRAAR
ncbi:hypothetical protein BON30_23680 [Cystobacter ferrugineus]|uniref:Bacterial toxin 44 domain-containing protein n=1 Tax=Cystobacter ferrugineus TaxID=83449 RepID=A0A1L9B7C1_9BACT|nr:hypothetical protein BON30_23680 [Cystobacter ferrugineus]